MNNKEHEILEGKKMKKTYLIFLLLSLLVFVGCLPAGDRDPKNVKSYLKDKYGSQFEVKSRSTMGIDYSFDAYSLWEMYPADNTDLIFLTKTTWDDNFIETYYSHMLHEKINKSLENEGIECYFLNLPLYSVRDDEQWVTENAEYYKENQKFPDIDYNKWGIGLSYYIFVPDDYSDDECATVVLKSINAIKEQGVEHGWISCKVFSEKDEKIVKKFYTESYPDSKNHPNVYDDHEDYWLSNRQIVKFILDTHDLYQEDLNLITDLEDIYWLREEKKFRGNNDNLVIKDITKYNIDADRLINLYSECYGMDFKVKSVSEELSGYGVILYQADTDISLDEYISFNEDGYMKLSDKDRFLEAYYYKQISTEWNETTKNIGIDMIYNDYAISIESFNTLKLPQGQMPDYEDLNAYKVNAYLRISMAIFMNSEEVNSDTMNLLYNIIDRIKDCCGDAEFNLEIYDKKYENDMCESVEDFNQRPFLNSNLGDCGDYANYLIDDKMKSQWLLKKIEIPSGFVKKIDEVDDLYRLLGPEQNNK